MPLAGNFLRDGKAEVAVFRRGTPSQFRIQRPDRAPKVVRFGGSTDQPVVGDWDGDGYTDVGVRTPGTRTFSLQTAAGVTSVVLGKPRDLPLAGDWDGDGRWEVGVRRAKSGRFVLRAADGTTRAVGLGDVSDVPVTGDWDGDGVTDLGVYDQAAAMFTLPAGGPGRTDLDRGGAVRGARTTCRSLVTGTPTAVPTSAPGTRDHRGLQPAPGAGADRRPPRHHDPHLRPAR